MTKFFMTQFFYDQNFLIIREMQNMILTKFCVHKLPRYR